MSKLQELRYDGELVFPNDYQFTPEQVADAAKLKPHELEWLMESCFGTFECSHPNWQDPPDEMLKRAGCLTAFFTDYALSWMNQ